MPAANRPSIIPGSRVAGPSVARILAFLNSGILVRQNWGGRFSECPVGSYLNAFVEFSGQVKITLHPVLFVSPFQVPDPMTRRNPQIA